MIFHIYTIISTCTQVFASQCIAIGLHGITILFSVKEADVEDADGNITKELHVLHVTPLESHAKYRLHAEDPDIFSDGGEDDKDGWVSPRVWPQIPIPLHRKRPAPSSSGSASSTATVDPCGSSCTIKERPPPAAPQLGKTPGSSGY